MNRKSVSIYLSVYDNEMTGLGTYASETVPKVISALCDSGVHVRLFIPEGTSLPISVNTRLTVNHLPKVVRRSVSGFFAPFFRLFVDAYYGRFINRNDLLYTPFSFAPLFTKRSIITIHDAICFHFPYQKPLQTLYFSSLLRFLAKRACSVITISETTRSDLLRWFRLDPARVLVVLNGLKRTNVECGQDYTNGDSGGFFPKRFFLAVGTTYEHKNMEMVFKSASLMRSMTPVVIIGPISEYLRKIVKSYPNLIEQGRIIIFGFASRSQFSSALRKCDAVIVPSKYEGFSLPVGEALVEGAKVIASDIPVHREIYSDYVTFFDPDSPQSLANILDTFDPEVSVCTNLNSLSSTCSWKSAAEKISSIIISELNS